MVTPSTMTPDEQRRWWQDQVQLALTTFDMPDATFDWLAYTHNAVFKVHDGTQTFVLRLQPKTSRASTRSEIAVLKALAENQLAAPDVVKTAELEETIALLLTHVSGIAVTADEASPANLYDVGQYLGRLHHAPLPTDGRPKLDWQGLFGEGGIYDPGKDASALFNDQQQRTITATTQRVRDAMTALNQREDELGLIHADLLLKNVLFANDGSAQALDWEYCGYGYYLYDLTPVLWMLKPQTHYDELEQALWDGYTSERSLSENHRGWLETLIAARQVASMRWIAANQHLPAYQGKVADLIAKRTAELDDFLITGKLRRT